MRTSRFSEEQVLQVLQEARAGTAVKVLCAKLNISPATFHAWKRKYGGMAVDQVRRLRSLTEENARLKRLVADGLLQIQILKEVNVKNGEPVGQTAGGPRQRERVRASGRGGLPRPGVPRSAFYRLPRRSRPSLELERRVVELSERHPRYGYRRITALLRRAGVCVNPKRVQRIRAEGGLRVRKRQRKARRLGLSTSERQKVTHPDHVWSCDSFLNRELFDTLRGAQVALAGFRREYNTLRPHSALRYLTPAEFAAKRRAELRSAPVTSPTSLANPNQNNQQPNQAPKALV